jgi:F0F1-type ATP synthase membrane subunit a
MLIGSTLQIILTIIEIGVALIQAYVIVTLLLLYLSETE